MNPTHIVVVSPDQRITSFLRDSLDVADFHVRTCKPGSNLVKEAVQSQVAIIDRIDERPDMAQREVAALKKAHPEILIIVIGHHSSDQDAAIINQGIFFYLVGYSEQKLLHVVQAAGNALSRTEISSIQQKSKF